MTPVFFPAAADFREWLEAHHSTAPEVLVGFYYKHVTTHSAMTYKEAVDEALCFGWIDGQLKKVDAISYRIRFTPRKKASPWSKVNLRRAEELIAAGRMAPAGLAAFETGKSNPARYSHETPLELSEEYAQLLAARPKAAEFFAAQPGSYRRAATTWVMNAKRRETQLSRLQRMIDHSERGVRLPQFTYSPAEASRKARSR